ncbi:hypothetical protein Ab1vBOLIVR4_gp106 [Agrobacterium phage OLIVR4]|nr:hypothetical protein Ab1vBOLIVR4_gp106 [Agrobacterium phage OLIVR4]
MLIELKDGDTIVIYGDVSLGASDHYKNMAESMTRGLKDTKVFMAKSAQDSIVVYRSVPSADPAEEHDGWFPMHTAPRDGQVIDVWAVDNRDVGSIVHGVMFYEEVFRFAGGIPVGERGTPTHWRYPVKGPKA